MLRGRCSCAVSVRPTSACFASPSLFSLLSPIIPVHRRHSPVSPIIPAHTQKHGGGGYLCSSSVLPSFVLSLYRDPVRVPSTEAPILSSCSPLATSHSALIPIIPAPLATAALRVVPAPIVTTTSSIHCRRADNFGVRRLAAALKVDTVAPYELFDRDGWHRKSGSKLPHSKKRLTDTARLPDRVGAGARRPLHGLSTFNFQLPFPGAGNILGGGCVLLDRGAQGCLPRRGRGERGALC